MRVLACSDLHADASTAGYPRFEDARHALSGATAAAFGFHADVFVFCGDLCDPDASNLVRCIDLARHQAGILKAHGIASVWVAGNHDVLEDGHGTTVLDPIAESYDGKIRVVTAPELVEVFREDGPAESIAVLPYAALSHTYDPEAALRRMKLEAKSPVKLIATHLMLEGISLGSETEDFPRGRDLFFPIDAARELFPDAVVIAGHYHAREIYRGVHVVGSMLRLTRADVGRQPFYLEIETI